MTGRTHDLAAFTALNIASLTIPLSHLTLGTLVVSVGANLIGGLAPDLDQSTSKIWHRIPAGTLLGKFISPFFGGHRFLSHSLIGLMLFGFLSRYLLTVISSTLLVDMNIVWWAFIIGYFSHLVMDSFTKEGVPWIFPIPVRLGIPPLKYLRMRTGGVIENVVVFPLLIFLNGYLLYHHYSFYIQLFRHL